MYSMIKKNMIKIIDVVNILFFRKYAKFVFIHENFFILRMTNQSAKKIFVEK